MLTIHASFITGAVLFYNMKLFDSCFLWEWHLWIHFTCTEYVSVVWFWALMGKENESVTGEFTCKNFCLSLSVSYMSHSYFVNPCSNEIFAIPEMVRYTKSSPKRIISTGNYDSRFQELPLERWYFGLQSMSWAKWYFSRCYPWSKICVKHQ